MAAGEHLLLPRLAIEAAMCAEIPSGCAPYAGAGDCHDFAHVFTFSPP